MKYTYEITRDDFANFSKFYYFKTRLKKSIITYAAVLIFVQFYLNRTNFDLRATIISTIFMIAVLVWAFYIGFNRVKKIPLENGTILGFRTLELTQDEIICITDSSSVKVNWSKVKSLENDKQYYYLFVDANSAHIIPKRVFANQDEELAFVTFATGKVKAKV